jgi:hypothetical protein
MAETWTDANIDLLRHIYELQSKSLTNAYYYGRRLHVMQTIAFWMEVAIAATASGSGLASLASIASGVWQTLILIAAAVAIVRPIYAPGKKIEHLSRLVQGYSTNYFALGKLSFAISQAGLVNDETRRRYDLIFDRHVQLSSDDEPTWNERLLAKAEERTKTVLPESLFWWPKSSQRSDISLRPIETGPSLAGADNDKLLSMPGRS